MSDRSNRRNPRKKPRYESSSDDGHSAVYSEKDGDGDSDSGGSYVPASTASSRRRSSSRSHHHHQHRHRDHSRASHRSHSHRHHQRSHRHSHHSHRRQKLLGPVEDNEKARDGMALAVREDYQVQTVPRAHHHGDDSDDDGEEVYDHRPKPLSHRSHSHAGVSSAGGRGGARGQQASDADKGFFMAAAALAVSLIICCGEADNN
ncbi:hypothetical protein LA080_009742 [Diaporthe eres]|uniref:Uncharacterized protein n=1 Tax=Diaporthe vaccinii TaxID=105482 RepID=A0ABR4EAK6_9PEZI|nr:hypothetical protein LA080_009742 [Diaporthe eres]